MKITIDIPQLDQIADMQSEMDSIDTELKKLLETIQATETPNGNGFALQLQRLLSKAASTVTNNPSQNSIEGYVQKYSEAIAHDTVTRWLQPKQADLSNRLKALQRQVQNLAPRHSILELKHRNDLYARIGDTATQNLADTVRAQVEKQLTEALSELEGITE